METLGSYSWLVRGPSGNWNTGLASETGWGGAVLWDQVLRYWELVTVLKWDLQDTHLVSGESDTYWVEGRKTHAFDCQKY